MNFEETLTIPCPKCRRQHLYILNVRRSIVFQDIKIGSSYASTQKSFRRLFSCPVTGDDFEASVVLTETPLNKIEGVEIKGPAKEE